jgi:siroheme synthase
MENISVELIAAETDPPLRSTEYQAGLKEVASALQATNAKVSFHMFMQEAIDAPSFLSGGFTIENAKSAALVVGPIVAAWLQSRYGRKVRLKNGDIEAEARNIEEIKALLEQAEKVRPQMFQAEPPKT